MVRLFYSVICFKRLEKCFLNKALPFGKWVSCHCPAANPFLRTAEVYEVPACQCRCKRCGFDTRSGRSPGVGDGSPLVFFPENPIDSPQGAKRWT